MAATDIPYYSLVFALISLLFSGTLVWIRIVEYRRDKKGVAVSYAITGDPNGHDSIYLTNLSAVPILVDYWELVWRRKNFLFFNNDQPINLHADEDLHMALQPRTRTSLNFADEYSFNWHPKNKGKVNLFIKLHIAGKSKPKYLFVYRPFA
ncbi:hypothetical protein BDD43_0183 [Mucilaginibacter gracilis]|uniref:Uncharacterized protein n=1 Tax=Mucilaginibacter gracilis TaxID=423350 RepID=A0A495ITU5_9SPHI|nr:hypothetical protein [Mucilaginibacter gracilis]RKR80090.1 hypothetical protein BDD43_0183 [Mucilaginibacter gracilis]